VFSSLAFKAPRHFFFHDQRTKRAAEVAFASLATHRCNVF